MEATHTPSPPSTKVGVELWLSSPWRRLLLALLAALFLSAMTTLIWLEAADDLAEAGRELPWIPILKRRLIFWTSWALAIEPIVWVGRMCVRYGRHWSLMLLLQVPLSILTSQGMDQGIREATQSLLGLEPPGPGEPGGRRGEGRRRPGRLQIPPPPAERLAPRERRRAANDAARRLLSPEQEELRQSRRRERGELAELERFYRNRADLGIFFYWAVLALGWGVRTYLVGREQERLSARLESDLTSAKLANLRNQLNPHFLFNALHSVGGLIRKREDDAALGMLSNLGTLLRASLESAKASESSLGEELALAEQFLGIEELRLGERLSVVTRVEPKLAQTPVPALVLLPLVENAIKYGIAPRPEGGTLEISAWTDGDYVYVELLDDGPGFNEQVLAGDVLPSERRTPIGIANTKARLKALYGASGVLQLTNRPEGGARVLMRVPSPKSSRGGEQPDA